MNKYFYDVEVFPNQSCVVFKNEDGVTDAIFTNNTKGLGEYADKGILYKGYAELKDYIKDKALYGYNNYWYDDYILYAMTMNLGQKVIKEWNDSIINNSSKISMKKINHETYDIFQQIDISKPSLKKIEGNMGHNIFESEIDFDKEELTADENLQVVKYCENDVLETITVYNMRSDYFESKSTVINMLEDDLKDKAYKWNTTSIVGQLLAPKTQIPRRRLVDDELLELVDVDVKNMWLELDTTQDFKFKTKKVIVEAFGCVFEFGWGGLHASPKGVIDVRNIKLYDVASMYPSLLINFNGLGDKTELYKHIKSERLRIKHAGTDKHLDKAYKLILNSTYGLLNNQYSRINNPYLAFSICIMGQISLWELSRMLHENGNKIINVNTDGVAFIPDNDGKYENIIHEWEETFNMTLELDEFSRWIQKDVNNYIAVTKSGKIKTKGGDVNNYLDYEKGGRNYYFNNANTRIVQKALVDYLLYDKDIYDTITENVDKPELYQYILQAGGTYQGTYDNNDNKLQKVNRVFAGKNTGYQIFKKRIDGGLVKFADAPSEMYLYNEDLKDLRDFEKKVDLEWYVNLTMKNLKRWKV